MAIIRRDEVLDKALAGDTGITPRYKITDPSGAVVTDLATIELANAVLQEGMPYSALAMNEVLAASGTGEVTGSAITLAQENFVLFDGAAARFRLSADFAPNPDGTLDVEGTGARLLLPMKGRYLQPIEQGKQVSVVYSMELDAWIVQGWVDLRPRIPANYYGGIVLRALDSDGLPVQGVSFSGLDAYAGGGNATDSNGELLVYAQSVAALTVQPFTVVVGDNAPPAQAVVPLQGQWVEYTFRYTAGAVGDYYTVQTSSLVIFSSRVLAVDTCLIGGGAGGGGSFLSSYAGGGGGGGGFVVNVPGIALNGLRSASVVIGAAGIGAQTSGLAATRGGTTSFLGSTAEGGYPGGSATSNSGGYGGRGYCGGGGGAARGGEQAGNGGTNGGNGTSGWSSETGGYTGGNYGAGNGAQIKPFGLLNLPLAGGGAGGAGNFSGGNGVAGSGTIGQGGSGTGAAINNGDTKGRNGNPGGVMIRVAALKAA